MRTDPCHVERRREKWEQRECVSCVYIRDAYVRVCMCRACIVRRESNLYNAGEKEDIIECERAVEMGVRRLLKIVFAKNNEKLGKKYLW